jgi:hypothetical protein
MDAMKLDLQISDTMVSLVPSVWVIFQVLMRSADEVACFFCCLIALFKGFFLDNPQSYLRSLLASLYVPHLVRPLYRSDDCVWVFLGYLFSCMLRGRDNSYRLSHSTIQLFFRSLCAACCSPLVNLGSASISDVFPPNERGTALSW